MSSTIHMIGVTNNVPYDAVFNIDCRRLEEMLIEKPEHPLEINAVGAIKMRVGQGGDAYYVGGVQVLRKFVEILQRDPGTMYNPDCERIIRAMIETSMCYQWWFMINW